ncbi:MULTISPECIES: LysE family translocator [unclassified Helicobacter]|uniref:LysE family translocator n=1 Tax=unclassified Helicobacter TaxID=2593540 RepID=UPI00131561CB|nr:MULTISPECIES: LysE family translocator [unclassified Helicobacter]
MFDFSYHQYSSEIASILFIWSLAVIMPGPDMFLMIRTSIRSKAQALGCAFGVVAGTLIWLLVGFFLIDILSKTLFFDSVKLLGGIYLIYMAGRIFMSINKPVKEEISSQPQKNTLFSFLLGVWTNLSNPKPPIFVSIILAKLPIHTPYSLKLGLLVLMLLIPLCWFYFVVQVFTIKKFLNIFLRNIKIVDISACFIFIYFGSTLIYEAIQKFLS